MAKVAGVDRADLIDPKMGDSYQIEWVEIPEPDLAPQPYAEAPRGEGNTASGPFVQGRDLGGLRMSRGEGIFNSERDRMIYIIDTSTGVGLNKDGGTHDAGFGEGSVWTFEPASDRLTCLFQAENEAAGNNFDNLTVSPRGGVLLCEDGGGTPTSSAPASA